jgi:threonine synthase
MADRSPAVARTNCEACGGPVSDAVLVCPHCGEKRAATAPTFTKAEIQAIIENDEALSAHRGSSALFKALLLPHKHTRGIVRAHRDHVARRRSRCDRDRAPR